MKKRMVFVGGRRAAALAFVCALAALGGAGAAGQEAARPRRAQTATPQQTPARPAQTPNPGPQIAAPPGAPQLKTPPPIRVGEEDSREGEQEIDPEEVVRVETNLVNLQVRVIDRNNRPVAGIRQDEFRVFENGVEQKIEFVTTEEVPISYGLVVDNSGSLRSQINQVIEAAKSIVESNKAGDETFVVRFVANDEIKILQDFTPDQQAVKDALDDMYVEGGQTAIVDAVYLSAEHASQHKRGSPLEDKRRRALILVTDGEDRASFYKRDQLFEALKENDVQIYVIGFVKELDREGGFIKKSPRTKAMNLLNDLAEATGGRAFYPNSLSELPAIAEEITKDLRTQYVVSYLPAVKARPGEFRQVRVAVADTPGREKRIAVTRSGYTGKPQQPAAAVPTASGGQPAPARKP